jgi:hypothetical protein
VPIGKVCSRTKIFENRGGIALRSLLRVTLDDTNENRDTHYEYAGLQFGQISRTDTSSTSNRTGLSFA